MVNDDFDWVTAAMTDDTLVVNVLLSLKKPLSTPLPFSWGTTQPRSRSRTIAAVSRCDAALTTRRSPTTPLSWSAAASPSATTDGCEDSTRHHHAAKSKATASSDEYTASTKRSKRKKTIAELKEEESSLLKERIYLKKEIEIVNATFEAERVKNESLKRKRMKLDMGSKSPSSTSVVPTQKEVISEPLTCANQDDSHSRGSQCRTNSVESNGEGVFMLPDLNMTPDDGSYTEAL